MQLSQSIELYKLMRDRCANSGFQNEQAHVYSDIINLIKDCDSLDQSSNKIKNSPYYLAPSIALIKDKINSWIRAAEHNNWIDVIDIYKDKISQIDKDGSAIYDSRYLNVAQEIKNDYINTIKAFGDVFLSYLSFKLTGENSYLDNLISNTKLFLRPSTFFVELAEIKIFREIIPCSDAGYEMFVNEVNLFIKNSIEPIKIVEQKKSKANNFIASIIGIKPDNNDCDIEDDWKKIKKFKSEVKKQGCSYFGKKHISNVVISSPNFKTETILNKEKIVLQDIKYNIKKSKVD